MQAYASLDMQLRSICSLVVDAAPHSAHPGHPCMQAAVIKPFALRFQEHGVMGATKLVQMLSVPNQNPEICTAAVHAVALTMSMGERAKSSQTRFGRFGELDERPSPGRARHFQSPDS